MKKGLLGILAVGLTATAANAATLSMRFAGGGTETTIMAPSDSVTIEVVLSFNVSDTGKGPSRATGIDARIDVGDLDASGAYSGDGSTKFTVTSLSPAPGFPNWNTAAASPVGGAFNGDFFFSAGDPTGTTGPTASTTTGVLTSAVIMSFTIHKSGPLVAGDTYVTFRVLDPLPALYNGSNAWGSRWQLGPENARNQYVLGAGNPGDAGPQWAYHGYETFSPLIIHNVPEPSALALLVLGGLAALRRRS